MFNFIKPSIILITGVSLSSCGGMIGGGCSGVELTTTPNRYSGTMMDVTIRNTSDEPKLVTTAIIDSDGSEINSKAMRVDAKDIVETSVGNMRDGVKIELVSCE